MMRVAGGFVSGVAVSGLVGVGLYQYGYIHTPHEEPNNKPVKPEGDVERPSVVLPSQEELTAFEQFEKDFEREYPTKAARLQAFNVFVDNFNFIKEENDKQSSYKLTINKFADMPFEQFRTDVLGYVPGRPKKEKPDYKFVGRHEYSGAELPEEVDWVSAGAVTPVKNQGQCGSCWSFSTTGALEGAWKIASGNLVSISEQEFVDCDPVDNGCNGGLMEHAFKFAEEHALCTEDSYAYEAAEKTCRTSSCSVAVPEGAVTGFVDVTPDDENALMEALSKQPVSIAIEADKRVFQFYHDGVLVGYCGHSLDHGVLAVGYGTWTDDETGKKTNYWKVKNSWGPEWGKEGFVNIYRGTYKDADGECGILADPSFPQVKVSSTKAADKVEEIVVV